MKVGRSIWYAVPSVTLSFALTAMLAVRAQQQNSRIEVGPAIPLPIRRMPIYIQASAAPDEPDRLLVCTWESDIRRARTVSAAYVSLDGGNTWMQTLLATTSDWVAETSCVAGTNGRAYFAASASDTSRGDLQHARGSAELYRSLDSGLDWTGPHRYPFIDWTALGVSEVPNVAHERIYLFGNHLASGIGDVGNGEWVSERRPMLISDDGLVFSLPKYPPDQVSSGPIGSFPLDVLTLDDGSIRVLYVRMPVNPFEQEWWYELYKWDGTNYASLSRIEPMPTGVHLASLLSGHMALDSSARFRGRLYVAFPSAEGNVPYLGLAKSDDGGKSWRTKVLLSGSEVSELSQHWLLDDSYAGIAVNDEGVVGIEWSPQRGCPIFLISTDGGESVSQSVDLGRCKQTKTVRDNSPATVAGRVVGINRRTPIDSSLSKADVAPGFDLRVRASVQEHVKVIADAKGRFHAFWTEERPNGNLTLLSTTLATKATSSERVQLQGAKDLTAHSLARIIDEQFDPETATFSIDGAIENIDSATMSYPTILEVITDHSDCGRITYLNASARSEDGHPLFRIPARPARPQLLPGERTLPIHMEIRVAGCEASRISLAEWRKREVKPDHSWSYLLNVRFRVYATAKGAGGK